MEITYSATSMDLDWPAHEAAQEAPDRPIRIRIQPTLLRQGNHRAWPGVSWTLECRAAEEAIEVRRALEAFFQMVATHGAEAVRIALTPPPGTA